jgi:pimeloyl-ACP methyl ester carboxylesterase
MQLTDHTTDNWGFSDVEAAVNSIPYWIEHAGWKGPRVDVDRWIVTGHSNGGQGAWYALTHRPDNIVAAAPLSGYASIQSKYHSVSQHFTNPSKNMCHMNCGSLRTLAAQQSSAHHSIVTAMRCSWLMLAVSRFKYSTAR